MKTLATLALSLFATAASVTAGQASDLCTPEESKSAKAPLTAFAHQSFLSSTHPDRLCLIILKHEAEPVQVAILDAGQNEIYATVIRADSALKPFNISALEAGTYTLRMRRGSQVELDTFQVK